MNKTPRPKSAKARGKLKSRLKQTAIRDREVNREWSQADLKAVLDTIRQDAKAKCTDTMTMREINQEIAAYRREKDPLYGQTHRISVTLSERMYRELKAAADATTGGEIRFIVRQALGDYLRQQQQPSKSDRQRTKITKAISESTNTFKTGRYEP